MFVFIQVTLVNSHLGFTIVMIGLSMRFERIFITLDLIIEMTLTIRNAWVVNYVYGEWDNFATLCM